MTSIEERSEGDRNATAGGAAGCVVAMRRCPGKLTTFPRILDIYQRTKGEVGLAL